MSQSDTPVRRKLFSLSLDGWAVAVAFALALLVRAGVLKHIPW